MTQVMREARMAAGRVEFVGSSCLGQLLRGSFSANVYGFCVSNLSVDAVLYTYMPLSSCLAINKHDTNSPIILQTFQKPQRLGL